MPDTGHGECPRFTSSLRYRKSHTLVITDDVYSLKPSVPQTLQFARAGTNTSSDTWVQWADSRTLHSSALSTRTFDYNSPGDEKSTNVLTLSNHGSLPAQAEVYEYTGAYTHLSQDRGDHLSEIRMEPAAIGDRDQRVKRQSAIIASTGQSYETDTYSLQNRVSISLYVRALLRWAPTGIARTLLGNDVVPIHHSRDIGPVFGVKYARPFGGEILIESLKDADLHVGFAGERR